jgi:hypothetical protein
MAGEAPLALVVLEVPEAQLGLAAGRGQPAAVGRELDADDVGGVATVRMAPPATAKRRISPSCPTVASSSPRGDSA